MMKKEVDTRNEAPQESHVQGEKAESDPFQGLLTITSCSPAAVIVLPAPTD